MRAAPLRRHRPVEEREIGAGAALRVGVEQVIRAHVVLIDRALHETHAERLRVEEMVVANLRRDRGQMMNAEKIHIHLPLSPADARAELAEQINECGAFSRRERRRDVFEVLFVSREGRHDQIAAGACVSSTTRTRRSSG